MFKVLNLFQHCINSVFIIFQMPFITLKSILKLYFYLGNALQAVLRGIRVMCNKAIERILLSVHHMLSHLIQFFQLDVRVENSRIQISLVEAAILLVTNCLKMLKKNIMKRFLLSIYCHNFTKHFEVPGIFTLVSGIITLILLTPLFPLCLGFVLFWLQMCY